MGRKFTIFALFYFVFEGKFWVQAPPGAYIQRGDLTEGFLRYDFGRLIFGGAYFRNLFSQHKPFNEVSDRSHNFLLLPFFFLLFQRIWFNSSNTTHISNTKHYNCRIQKFRITQNLCAKTCTRIQCVSFRDKGCHGDLFTRPTPGFQLAWIF